MAQALLQVAFKAVISYFLQGYDEQRTSRQAVKYKLKYGNSGRVDVAYTGATTPRRRLYGYFRASGLNCLPAVATNATGTRLHQVLALSDGEIQSIDAVWFNNERIAASEFAGGPIVSGTYTGQAQIYPHLGLASQSVDSTLSGQVAAWDSSHTGNGVAYVYFNYLFNPTLYANGPPVALVEGKGAKVYDPRLDTSPGAHPTTLTYYAFTTNPALILADFITWSCGGNELPANILWSDVVTAANICDEDCAIPGSTVQDRYTCSIEVYAPQTLRERDETILMLARAMLGACWFSGGKWYMRAGAYTSPVGSIGDADFAGGQVTINTSEPSSGANSFNTVRGTFVDQTENSQPKSFPEVSSSTYVTEDGEVVYTDLEIRTARSAYEAERNAIQLLRLARENLRFSATMKFRCWKFLVYDIVNVTCTDAGVSAQPCRITRTRLKPDFTVDMDFEEVASTDFSDPLTSDYLTPSLVGVPTSTSYAPNSPQNLAATGATSAIVFTWSPPLTPPVGVIYRLYEYTASTPFSSATQIGSDTAQTSIVIPKTDTTVRYYWIVAVDPATGAVSTQAPPSNGVPGGATSASASLGAVVTPGSATVDGYTSSLTTNTVTVTPTGGTPGYTYATTFTSGGSGITINNGTTASPSFTATGLAEGDVKSGTARIRVTDSAAATADVFVAVTITRLYGVTLTNTTVTSNGGTISPPAVSTYTVTSTGDIAPSPGTSYQWKNPSALASDYDVRFTLTSGTLYSGTTGTWLQLSSSQFVQGVRLPGAGAGTSTQTVTVEIRLHATPFTVLATATATLIETIT